MEPEVSSEVIALLFPEQGPAGRGTESIATALLRDAQGLLGLRSLVPDASVLRQARVVGRMNRGKPIVDPASREVIGYEIEPLADAPR